jgi:hypothetical protein
MTKNKMGVCHPEGCITDSRNTRMDEMSWKQRKMGHLWREARAQNGL